MLDSTVPTSPIANVRHEIRPEDKEARLAEAVEKVQAFQKASLQAAEALAEIKDDELWTVDAESFVAFARDKLGYRRRRAYQLARAGRCYCQLKSEGVSRLPISEAQVRPLTALSNSDERVAAWKRALGRLGDVASITDDEVRGLTQEDVDRAVAEVEGRPRRRKDASGPARDGALSPRARDYAAVEDALRDSDAAPPSPALHAEHYGLLGRVEARDQAEVWARVAKAKKSGTVVRDGLLQPGEGRGDDRKRKAAIEDALVGLADEEAPRPETPPPSTGGFRVLLERELLSDEKAGALTDADTIGGSLLVDHASAEPAARALVGKLDAETERDVKARISRAKRPNLGAQRAMARTRLEPEVAAWAWHVLIPDPRCSATTWLPEPDAPAPCYVPARLTQPANTDRGGLVVTAGNEPEYELPAGHAVLLAPGVDVLHNDVPNGVLDEILNRARGAEDFVFLAVTRQTQRLPQVAWPTNVRPVVPVSDERGLRRAVDAFSEASIEGGLVFDGYADGLSDQLRTRVKKHALAAIVRGEATSRAAYDALLALRGPSFAVLIGPRVPHRPRDTPFGDPATLPEPGPQLSLPGTPGSGVPAAS